MGSLRSSLVFITSDEIDIEPLLPKGKRFVFSKTTTSLIKWKKKYISFIYFE
ncbi:MAG: hypothetical protein ACTSO9_07290 [Candidatus Helarchaeota archaeon]